MHYRVDATHLHAQLQRSGANADTGWLGVGFPENPGDMLGAIAVLGMPHSRPPASPTGRRASEAVQVGMYRLQGYAASTIVPLSDQTLENTSLTSDGGVTTMRFSKRLEETGHLPIATDGNQRAHLIFAMGPMGAQAALGYHGASSKASVTLTLSHPIPAPAPVPPGTVPDSPTNSPTAPSMSSPIAPPISEVVVALPPPSQPLDDLSDPLSTLLGVLGLPSWQSEQFFFLVGAWSVVLLCFCSCCCCLCRLLRASRKPRHQAHQADDEARSPTRRREHVTNTWGAEAKAPTRPRINRLSQRKSTRYNQMHEDACELTTVTASSARPPPPPPRDDHELELPPDWEVATTDSGELYYFNHQTGESQWTRP